MLDETYKKLSKSLGTTSALKPVPLFKPTPTPKINYAKNLLIENPTIEKNDPQEIFPEDCTWLTVPFVDAELATQHHLPEQPSETFAEFLQRQSLEWVDPENIVICEMNERVGRGAFADGPIRKGQIIPYNTVIVAADQSQLPAIVDPYIITLEEPSEKKTLYAVSKGFRSHGQMLQDLRLPSLLYQSINPEIADANFILILLEKQGVKFPVLQATRDIKKGEILGWNYGNQYKKIMDKSSLTRLAKFTTNGVIVPDDYIATLEEDVARIKQLINLFLTKRSDLKTLEQLKEGLQKNYRYVLFMLTNKEREYLYTNRTSLKGIKNGFAASSHLETLAEPLPEHFNKFRYLILPPYSRKDYIENDLVPYHSEVEYGQGDYEYEKGMENFKAKKYSTAIAAWQEALEKYIRIGFLLILKPEQHDPNFNIFYKLHLDLKNIIEFSGKAIPMPSLSNDMVAKMFECSIEKNSPTGPLKTLAEKEFKFLEQLQVDNIEQISIKITKTVWNLGNAYFELSKTVPFEDKLSVLEDARYFLELRLAMREAKDLSFEEKNDSFKDRSITEIKDRLEKVTKAIQTLSNQNSKMEEKQNPETAYKTSPGNA